MQWLKRFCDNICKFRKGVKMSFSLASNGAPSAKTSELFSNNKWRQWRPWQKEELNVRSAAGILWATHQLPYARSRLFYLHTAAPSAKNQNFLEIKKLKRWQAWIFVLGEEDDGWQPWPRWWWWLQRWWQQPMGRTASVEMAVEEEKGVHNASSSYFISIWKKGRKMYTTRVSLLQPIKRRRGWKEVMS